MNYQIYITESEYDRLNDYEQIKYIYCPLCNKFHLKTWSKCQSDFD